MDALSQQSSIKCLLCYEDTRAGGQKASLYSTVPSCTLCRHIAAAGPCHPAAAQRLLSGFPCGAALGKGKTLWILSAEPQLDKAPCTQRPASSVCQHVADTRGSGFVNTLGHAPLCISVQRYSVMHESSSQLGLSHLLCELEMYKWQPCVPCRRGSSRACLAVAEFSKQGCKASV